MIDITAFGEILIDFTYTGTSEAGQKLFEQNPGGAPANVLVCANKLGSTTAFIGKAGADMHGEFLKDTLHQEGVNTEGFVLDENHFTTLAFVDLSDSGERTFSFARKPGADTQMSHDELAEGLIEKSRIFHVGSLSLTNEPSKETTIHALALAREKGVIISYDPNYRASLWKNEKIARREMRQIIPDIMKISDEETHLLTSHEDYKEAAKELLERGVTIVVVTLGNQGAYVCTKEGGAVVAGYSSTVVDTTGAGDAFWGGFLHKIAESNMAVCDIPLEQLESYVDFANAVASLCVEQSGAIPAMPTLETVYARQIV
ncbi:MAG: carbohydrate kinase [Eubacteriales bacterium]